MNHKRTHKSRVALRLLAAALCAAVTLSATGCATSAAIADGKDFQGIMDAVKTDLFGSKEQNCTWLSLSMPVRAGFDPVEDKSAYESLTNSTMREVYEAIEQSIYQVSDEIDEKSGYYLLKYTRLPSQLEFDDIYIVKEAVLTDHPEAFWVLGGYDIRNNFHDGNFLVLYSKYSYGEIMAAFDEINATTEQILSQIPDRADEFRREMIIHDALVDLISYDFAAAESDDSTADAFNMYGALVKRQAVCSGYATAAKMLLNRVGIRCRTVVGMSKNSGHMWNQVMINDNWYHLDVTWDDSAKESNVIYSRYNYFNLNDELAQGNHQIGKNYKEMVCEYTDEGVYTTAELYNFDLEPCDTLEDNYYERYAAHVTEMNDAAIEAITECIIDVTKDKGDVAYILFDGSISQTEAEDWLINSTSRQYSALRRAVINSNNYAIGARVKTFSLVRMTSEEDNIWRNLYPVHLMYS